MNAEVCISGGRFGRILGAIACSLSLFTACQKPSAGADKPEQRPELDETPTLPPEDKEAAALAALEDFFKAEDIISRAKVVRDGLRVLPMMRDYYEVRGHPLPAFGRVSRGKEAALEGIPMVFFDIEAFDGPHYYVAVVWDGERFAVDWESLTAYGTMDWSDFLEEKPTEPQEMRVFVLAARGIPNFPGSPEGSTAFRIEHRDHPQPLIATADAELAKKITPMVKGRRVPVTLELAWKAIGPGGAPVPVILRIVAPSWSP